MQNKRPTEQIGADHRNRRDNIVTIATHAIATKTTTDKLDKPLLGVQNFLYYIDLHDEKLKETSKASASQVATVLKNRNLKM